MSFFRKISALFQPASSPKAVPRPGKTIVPVPKPPLLTPMPSPNPDIPPESGRSVSFTTDDEMELSFTGISHIRPVPVPIPESVVRLSERGEGLETEDRDPLQLALIRLRDESVWSVAQAESILGPLEPLVAAEVIIVAASAVGRIVCLGREGRRAVQENIYKTFSVEGYENLLYFRLAAQYYHWRVEREPPFRNRRAVGLLDQLGKVNTLYGTRYVMARVTAGGYDSRTVAATYRRMRTMLIADNAALLVVTPDRGKIGRMHSRQGMLEVVELKIQ